MPKIMYLDDSKVFKRFGSHPERGRLIRGKVKKVTVGVRWSLPKCDYEVDDDVDVHPTIALRCVGKGKWEVLVAEEYRQYAETWLVDNCM